MTLTDTVPPLDEASFRTIAELAHRESGLVLPRRKSSMVQSRLRKRLLHLGLADFAAYSAFVASDAGQAERRHLISALTTNVSQFFRESYHFDILRKTVESRASELRRGGRMRIWSAGCAQGQEAYSAGMVILDVLQDAADLDIRVLGTDIDPNIIAQARDGVFSRRSLSNVPRQKLASYFTQDGDDPEQFLLTHRRLRRMVTFNELNILGPWPLTCPVDFIFCRNVVIYFDGPTNDALWPRFAKALTPDGKLFLGHSERISNPAALGFHCIGPTTYALQKGRPDGPGPEGAG